MKSFINSFVVGLIIVELSKTIFLPFKLASLFLISLSTVDQLACFPLTSGYFNLDESYNESTLA